MTGIQQLIVAVIIVFVIAFVITMIVFSSEDIKTSSSFRHLGIPVRPVRAAVQ